MIHSDFDTNINRQDIEEDSERNGKLLKWVAKAFVNAVEGLCRHPSLAFTWPLFLPCLEDPARFWRPLSTYIRDKLSGNNILRCHNSDELRPIGDVLLNVSGFQNDDHSPLLDDPDRKLFLSSEYSSEASKNLCCFGLREIGDEDMLELLEKDLARPSSESMYKRASTEHGWHEKLARLLRTMLMNHDDRLRRMSLLPLQSGEWISAAENAKRNLNSGQACLSTTEGIALPTGLPVERVFGLEHTPERGRLFYELGLRELSVKDARSIIVNNLREKGDKISSGDSRSQLLYLYETRKKFQDHRDDEKLSSAFLWTSNHSVANPSAQNIYLETDDRLGPKELLAKIGDVEPPCVTFLSRAYGDLIHPQNSDWQIWLRDSLRLQQHVVLTTKEGNALSDEFKYVAKHRPESLLRLLKQIWDVNGYEKNIDRVDKRIIDEIRNLDATKLCLTAKPLAGSWNLTDTYLPLQRLRKRKEELMRSNEDFPFLDLRGHAEMMDDETSERADKELAADWAFLHSNFWVRPWDHARFLVDILCWRKIQRNVDSSSDDQKRVYQLYAELNGCLNRSMGAMLHAIDMKKLP